jgi:cell wall-associated NlpC family hydrolase
VDHFYHQAEKASERYNAARIDLRQAHSHLTALQLDIDRQSQRVDDIREEVVANVVAEYQGSPLSEAGQVVLADDPEAFLGQLTTISQYSADRSAKVDELSVEVDRLEMRQDELSREVSGIARTKERLAHERATIREKAADAKKLLSRLKTEAREAREARASRSESRVPTSTAVSGSAGAAVSYALAQVGDAYVYGAAGPSAFDCSGLTMAAWGSAGVSLPHSSSAQMGYGTPVSISALQPGDLVFYYSPVSHVAMYIGNGMIVHAANPSQGVRTDPVGLMPIAGAVRPG